MAARRSAETDGTIEVQPIYWGARQHFEKLRTTHVPMFGSYGVSVADLNRDGYLDLVLSGISGRPGAKTDVSRIYYGSKAASRIEHYRDLDVPGAEPAADRRLQSRRVAGHRISESEDRRDGGLDAVLRRPIRLSPEGALPSYLRQRRPHARRRQT